MSTERERREQAVAEVQAAMAEFSALAAEMNEHMARLQLSLQRVAAAVLNLAEVGLGFPGTSSYENP